MSCAPRHVSRRHNAGRRLTAHGNVLGDDNTYASPYACENAHVVWGDAPRGSRSPNPPNLRLTILRAVLRCFLLTTPDRRVVALAAAFAVGDAAPSCAPLRAQVMRLPVRLACESPARLPPPSSLLAPEAVRSQY